MTDTDKPTKNALRQEDQMAIAQVLVQHSRGLDRCDQSVLADCYWPNAAVDYGAYKGPASDFVALVIAALQSQYQLTCHQLHNSYYQFDGDSAQVETLVLARHLSLKADEEMIFNGRYLDQLKRDGDIWRLQHRQVVADWVQHRPVENLRESADFNDLAKGSNTPGDPSFDHFLKTRGMPA